MKNSNENKFGLAIDTSSKSGGISLFKGGELLETKKLSKDISHSEILLQSINELFDFHRVHKNEFEFTASCTGPGNFTGIRIGQATAKGLAAALNCIYIGITKFQAYSVLAEGLVKYSVYVDSTQKKVLSQSSQDLLKDNEKIQNYTLEEFESLLIKTPAEEKIIIQESLLDKNEISKSHKANTSIDSTVASDNVSELIANYIINNRLLDVKHKR